MHAELPDRVRRYVDRAVADTARGVGVVRLTQVGEMLGERSVEVSTRVGTSPAAVSLHFDAAGDVVRVSADGRPRLENGDVVERAWSGDFSDYGEVGGLRIPTRAEVAWELPEGRFVCFRGTITGVESRENRS